ncbi:MAG: uridine phosphorylase, partial [Deltaproteobacteria bacterium]|nr:uridine phosphorylase [Deltaproteobacteria bacterium]
MGLKGGCITGVVNRGGIGKITKDFLKKGEEAAIKTAVAALEYL